jgi:hypothetical protein
MAMMEAVRSWRRNRQAPEKEQVATPLDRAKSFDRLAELEQDRKKVPSLQRAVDEAREKLIETETVVEALRRDYAQRLSQARNAVHSIDGATRRAETILRQTSPGIIDEFIGSLKAELAEIRNGGQSERRLETGRRFGAGNEKSVVSENPSKAARCEGILRAMQVAESLKLKDLSPDVVVAELSAIYDRLPAVQSEEIRTEF